MERNKVQDVVSDEVTSERKITFSVDAVFQSAVMEGDVMEMLHLLNHDNKLPDVNKQNHMGMTPLHQSVLQNNLDSAKVLICHGANVDAQDSNGYSPLHAAAACDSKNMAALLILFGAVIFLTTHDGDLAVDLTKDIGISQMLLSAMIEKAHSDTYLISWCKYYILELWNSVYKLSLIVYKIINEFIRKYKNIDNKKDE